MFDLYVVTDSDLSKGRTDAEVARLAYEGGADAVQLRMKHSDGREMLEQALLYPRQSVELGVTFKNIMSVNVPEYSFHTKNNDPSEIYPYGFAQTSGELDDALEQMAKVFEDMLELAQVEKTMQLLAEEIERTRRRVNALEYVMIPELEENIRYITMKLEENENSTKVRLLKVKEMVLENAHKYST